MALTPVDPARYTSRDFQRREWHAMWKRVWLMAAHESELPHPGSYRAIEVGPESILVVRQDDGSVRAFHNVCVHRGSPLCGERAGRRDGFRCSYHGWRYDRAGALVEAPGVAREALPPGPRAVRAARAVGFVWITLDPDADDVEHYLGEVATLLEPYRLGEWRLTQDLSMELPCNWKLSCDAHNESYHVHALHPEVLAILDDTAVEFRALDLHSRMVVPFGVPSARLGAEVPAALAAWARGQGVDAAAHAGDRAGLRRALEVAARDRAAGTATAALSDAQLLDTHQFHVFPNLQLNQRADELLLFRHWPHPGDPERMVFEQQSFSRRATGPADGPAHRRLATGAGGFGPVTDADVAQLLRQRGGLGSSGLDRLWLTDEEPAIAHMHRSLDRFLAADDA
jgi:phenylpropionate dioxygenase-like ring-hydroxylating dioxygenase large terminal subunit